jgi:hypothetical protein
VNPAWTATLGWPERDVLGKTPESLVHPDDLERTRAELKSLLAGRKTTYATAKDRCRFFQPRYVAGWRSVTGKEPVLPESPVLIRAHVGAVNLLGPFLARRQGRDIDNFRRQRPSGCARPWSIDDRPPPFLGDLHPDHVLLLAAPVGHGPLHRGKSINHEHGQLTDVEAFRQQQRFRAPDMVPRQQSERPARRSTSPS